VQRDWNYDHHQVRGQSERSEILGDIMMESQGTQNATSVTPLLRWLEEKMSEQPYHGIKAVRGDVGEDAHIVA